MTYRQLQIELKQLRNEGKIPASFKLNQKKVILQAMWDEINAEALPSSLLFRVVRFENGLYGIKETGRPIPVSAGLSKEAAIEMLWCYYGKVEQRRLAFGGGMEHTPAPTK